MQLRAQLQKRDRQARWRRNRWPSSTRPSGTSSATAAAGTPDPHRRGAVRSNSSNSTTRLASRDRSRSFASKLVAEAMAPLRATGSDGEPAAGAQRRELSRRSSCEPKGRPSPPRSVQVTDVLDRQRRCSVEEGADREAGVGRSVAAGVHLAAAPLADHADARTSTPLARPRKKRPRPCPIQYITIRAERRYLAKAGEPLN